MFDEDQNAPKEGESPTDTPCEGEAPAVPVGTEPEQDESAQGVTEATPADGEVKPESDSGDTKPADSEAVA